MPSMTRVSTRRRAVRAMSAFAAGVVAVLLAACGGSSSRNSSSTDARSTSTASAAAASDSGTSAAAAAVAKLTAPVTTYPAVAPVKGAASLKGKTVWIVPIGQAVPGLAVYASATQAALRHLGIATHLCDGQFLPTTIATCLNQAVSRGADAVVTIYVDYRAVPTAMNNLVAHNIPVLLAGEANDAGSGASKLLGFYNADPLLKKTVSLAVDAAIADSNGKAQILYLGAVDSPSLLRLNAAAAQEAKARCPSCAFHALTYLTPDIRKIPSQISAALIKHPDTNYIVMGQDTAVQQVIQGVQSAGFGKKVKITTEGGELPALQQLNSGDLVAQDVGISPIYSGWGYADGIVRLMLGQAAVSYVGGIRVFDKHNIGSLTLTPAAFATNDWYGPTLFESAFLKAWGAK